MSYFDQKHVELRICCFRKNSTNASSRCSFLRNWTQHCRASTVAFFKRRASEQKIPDRNREKDPYLFLWNMTYFMGIFWQRGESCIGHSHAFQSRTGCSFILPFCYDFFSFFSFKFPLQEGRRFLWSFSVKLLNKKQIKRLRWFLISFVLICIVLPIFWPPKAP